MAAGKISIQANDGKVAGIVFEDGASSNVTVTVPKEGGVVATEAYADTKVSKTGDETIAGVKTFSSSPIVPVPTLANQVISMGHILERTGATIGYGNGSGGTVTQLTSKSTNVTLNKTCGQITMNSAALAAGGVVTFSVNNSLLSVNNTVLISGVWGVSPSYKIEMAGVGPGVFMVRVTNNTANSLSEAVQLNFTIINGAIV